MGFLGDISRSIGNAAGTQVGWRATPVDLQQANYNPEIAQMLGGGDQTLGTFQNDYVKMLRSQAIGESPNLAQQQFYNALAQGQQQQAAATASQKGINPALANRLIGEQGASYNQQAAQGSAGIQLATQNQYLQALQAARGQNLERLQALGGLQNAQNQLAVQNQLGAQGINANIETANAGNRQELLGAQAKFWGDSSAAFMGGMGKGMGAAHGGKVHDFTDGGEVPGEAVVSGDDEANDVVHAMLSPDEIVLPRTIAMDESGEKAKEFVQAIAKQSKPKGGYQSVITAKKNCGGKV